MNRFWNKVDTKNIDSCWPWIAAKDQDGYGLFKLDGKMVGAHRVSWGLSRGEVTNKQHVLHKCDNPSCVNPNHLFLGTPLDNARDRERKKRGKSIFTYDNLLLLSAMAQNMSSAELATFFNCHQATINRNLKRVLREASESN